MSIFLFLRDEDISMEIGNSEIRYVDFLVLGIFVWRTSSFILGRLPTMIKEDAQAIRSIMSSQGGGKVLLWSCIATTFSIAMLVGASIILTAILLYNFSVFSNYTIYALIAFLLIIIVHFEIAIILFFSRIQKKNLKNIGFIATTIFGLFSGVFFPVESFPFPLDNIAYALPLTQGLSILRELLLYPNPMPDWHLSVMLSLETAFLFIITVILYKKSFKNIHIEKW
jgi:ABC-type polysaccharide/polyol phosphate export permease